MGKKEEKKKSKAADEAQPQGPTSTPSNILTTTSAIAADPTLGYKVRVLLYDFLNVTKDKNSGKRINRTTDEHSISGPYFDETQVAIIKAATVDVDLDRYAEDNGTEDLDSVMVSQQGQSFEDAVRALRTLSELCCVVSLIRDARVVMLDPVGLIIWRLCMPNSLVLTWKS